VIPLYVLTTIVAAGFSLFAITRASTVAQLTLVAAFGDSAIYFDDQPDQGELFDGAHDDRVCAGGFPHRKTVLVRFIA